MKYAPKPVAILSAIGLLIGVVATCTMNTGCVSGPPEAFQGDRALAAEFHQRLDGSVFNPDFHVLVAEYTPDLPPNTYRLEIAGGFYRVEIGQVALARGAVALPDQVEAYRAAQPALLDAITARIVADVAANTPEQHRRGADPAAFYYRDADPGPDIFDPLTPNGE